MALGRIVQRLFLIVFGMAAIAWAIAVWPKFWASGPIGEVASHVIAGELYKPDSLEALLKAQNEGVNSDFPARALGKIAIVRLRLAELAFGADFRPVIDERLATLANAIDGALVKAPSDSFLWLVRFWLTSTRSGFNAVNLRDLQMSYELGPNEGWIAVKRNRLAIAIFPYLSPQLADMAVSEFVGLVRSRLYAEAADIVQGPGRPIRNVLFARLTSLKESDRQSFAKVLYDRDLDDVLVPGVPAVTRNFRR